MYLSRNPGEIDILFSIVTLKMVYNMSSLKFRDRISGLKFCAVYNNYLKPIVTCIHFKDPFRIFQYVRTKAIFATKFYDNFVR